MVNLGFLVSLTFTCHCLKPNEDVRSLKKFPLSTWYFNVLRSPMTNNMKRRAKVRSAFDSPWSFVLPFVQSNELLFMLHLRREWKCVKELKMRKDFHFLCISLSKLKGTLPPKLHLAHLTGLTLRFFLDFKAHQFLDQSKKTLHRFQLHQILIHFNSRLQSFVEV